jgi:DNA-directed RNA polymerase specialized sigma subunit
MSKKNVLENNPFEKLPSYKKASSPFPEEYTSWKKDPSRQNLGALMKKVDPVIDKALTSYAGDMGPTLKTKARLMSVDYIKSYDPKKGMALSSYLIQNLQALNREKANRAYVIHMPENIILTKNKLHMATKEFMSTNGRDPNLEELADATGISKKHIANAQGYRPALSGSIAQTEKGDSLFEKKKDYGDVWSEYVYYDLTPIDKKIYEWTTGYMGTPTMPKQEIAKKLKMTPAAISFRINKIVSKLEEGMTYAHRS